MRRSKKYQREVRELNTASLLGYDTTQTTADGFTYKVKNIPAARKEYVCPGCGGTIRIGESHLVAWTEDNYFGAEAGQRARRHWHKACWRRGPRTVGRW